jgi:hypothetical protein
MSLLDVNLNDSKEFVTLPDNQEANLVVIRAELTESKSQSPATHNLALTLGSSDRTDTDDVRVWLPVPNVAWQEADEKGYTKAVNRIKDFCDCFGITMPCEVEDMVGSTGWCLIGEAENDREPGTMQNFIRRYNVARG